MSQGEGQGEGQGEMQGDESQSRLLVVEKRYNIQTQTTQTLAGDDADALQFVVRTIGVREILPHIFTWPCSLVLAAFLSSQPTVVRDKVVVELGSGTAVPSVVASLSGARLVLATERDDATMQSNLSHCLALNPEAQTVRACALDWYLPTATAALLSTLPSPARVDVILASDVLYSSEDFFPLMSVVAQLLGPAETEGQSGHAGVCYMTYQERSNSRTLVPHLDAFQLRAEAIPLSSFLHSAHSLGVIAVVTRDEGRRRRAEQRLPTFDDIHLLKITRRV